MPAFREKNQTVLVSSSENAIRGMLMHLLNISKDDISSVEIPTGLPLIYDHGCKCIKLLDDGTDDDILTKYNFGRNPELLFQPCNLQEHPEECVIVGGRSYEYDPLIRLRRKEPVKKPSPKHSHSPSPQHTHRETPQHTHSESTAPAVKKQSPLIEGVHMKSPELHIQIKGDLPGRVAKVHRDNLEHGVKAERQKVKVRT
eukprot:gnl/MRDRNA2_/MRDRNA2_404367_c0_seq1.p1 gnl/MRDRNA2_/MRDRNA2_404367_c0~~gnl/MRDRNA2_/MRDRNA2_404367_c0_seq1.p1  ORF type:complete len:214 (+),score=30.05 gnl/MRDRNA2_/MRDRNA2_404367_c0_seq1:44-643(+)